MAMTFNDWADRWLRYQISKGVHPAIALSTLEDFGRWYLFTTFDPIAPPRIVNKADRYIILEVKADQLAIFCRKCCQTSFNANDVKQLYCSHCKQFHNS
jgi:hypothetical protein